MWKNSVVGAATLALLTACGGSGGGGGSSEPAVDPVLEALVAQAGAATAIAGCDGLDQSGPGADRPADRGRKLPDLRLACLGGGDAVTVRDLRGPMLLNVWASWCGPCKDELPYLTAAKGAVGDRVRFAAIAIADADEDSRRWMSFHGVAWPSLADPDTKIRGPLRVTGPPVTLFVGRDGTVTGTHYGAFTSARQVQDAIAEHLGVTS